MNIIRTAGFALALSVALIAPAVKADTITNLYNTGVTTQSTLNAQSSVDQHYQLVSVTTQGGSVLMTNQDAYVVNDNGASYPGNVWTPNTTKSQWVSFAPSADASNTNDIYDYQTTFTLSNQANLATAIITGALAADDGAEIFLNGHQVTNEFGGYSSMTDFTINKDFQTGTNTLDFVVNNAGYYATGLQVNMVGTVSTPEPAGPFALGIGLLGLLGLGVAAKSRKANIA